MQSGVPDSLAALAFAVFAVGFAFFWVMALVDLVQRSDAEFPSSGAGSSARMLWSVIVVLFGGVGGFIYYLRVMRPHPRRRR